MEMEGSPDQVVAELPDVIESRPPADSNPYAAAATSKPAAVDNRKKTVKKNSNPNC